MGPERNEIQLLSNTAAKGSGLFGNIRNILEIIQKYFWKIVKLCDKDLKFMEMLLQHEGIPTACGDNYSKCSKIYEIM